MTKKKAKKITLEVWDYLGKHGEITSKGDLPYNIGKKISSLSNKCPLCELFLIFTNIDEASPPWEERCPGCPLKEANNQCEIDGSFYNDWAYSYEEEDNVRSKAAKSLADIVRNWNIS